MSKLYIISPPEINLNDFAEKLDEALNGNEVGAFQLRLKNIELKEVANATKKLLPICKKYSVSFFINDFYEIARDFDIDGIHIGQNDISLENLKKEFGNSKIIGVTCQNSRELANNAKKAGANYVSFGAFFPTKTKKNTVKADISILNWAYNNLNLPFAAIGGINHDNVKNISKTGVDFICVISAIWNYKNGANITIKELNKIIKENSCQKKI